MSRDWGKALPTEHHLTRLNARRLVVKVKRHTVQRELVHGRLVHMLPKLVFRDPEPLAGRLKVRFHVQDNVGTVKLNEG